MILYFSGTGNSAYVANRIGYALQDETLNLLKKLRDEDYSTIYSEKTWVVVTPTYAWQIPHILRDWLKKTQLKGNKDIYFVMTCGGNIGNAESFTKSLSISKGLIHKGCFPVRMPENYIALFKTPTEKEAADIIEYSDHEIQNTIAYIENNKDYVNGSIHSKDKINSSFINHVFYPLIVHAKKFHATDECISCGQCVRLCPLKNISLENGKPIWRNQCTHCMACINRCPKEAIEYGNHSINQKRYICPKES